MNGTQIIKQFYRMVLPASFRRAKIVQRFKSAITPHQILYDKTYYEECVEPGAVSASGPIAGFVIEKINPKSVIDIDCGTGAIAQGLKKAGCETLGLEYSTAGLSYCRERGLDVVQFDLENDDFRDLKLGKYDLAISTEIAEHLPESCAERFVDTLCGLSNLIFLTAATPGQGGDDHVNEQPQEYWIEKFTQRGLVFDEALSLKARRELGGNALVAKWYSTNIMIFR
jgi:SAM-dependent methyltransferase